MRVGDLVKVYDFSHVARKRLVARLSYTTEQANSHTVGLIVATIDSDPKHRKVLRCVDGEQEYYNVNRLEVINESR
jgi:SPX domain protein involved in polyphosphate accumulation